jgi:uncharacterized protein (TIGR02594 family)
MEVPWLDSAMKEVGVHEIPGPKAEARIVWYDSFTTLKATSDEVPWCSAFACAMMEVNGIESPKSAAARSWLSWGEPLDGPKIGAVVVFSRGTNPAAGHVGFVKDVNADGTLQVLGGNQGDKVCVATFNTSHALGYRWPKNYS